MMICVATSFLHKTDIYNILYIVQFLIMIAFFNDYQIEAEHCTKLSKVMPLFHTAEQKIMKEQEDLNSIS